MADTSDVPTVRRCGTDAVHQRLLLEDPEYAVRRAAVENQAWRAARMPPVARQGCTRIPVVVHVVHRVAAENISKAQIDSQIVVLNADFRKKNVDVAQTPAPYLGLAADARVEFALATTDPAGKPTDGVTRTKTSVNGFTMDEKVKSAATGGADPWPSSQYLNMWVCRLAGGLLGYAAFPGAPAALDGVVVTHTGFGTSGTAAAPFNLGRTATHEIGHWLNLLHIWGDDGMGCNGSDQVADTPNQGGANTGMLAFPTVSCANGPHGDMFMNYMDYTDDAGMFMFTVGQVDRMHAALDGPRASVGTSFPCLKLKFADDPVTLKFRDDLGTLKFTDDIGTLKRLDDPIGTLKFRDDLGTLKFSDDGGGTDPRIDPVKSPALDKPPWSDIVTKVPGTDGPPVVDPLGPVVQPGLPVGGVPPGPSPFVLATPHHSMAWAGDPGAIVAEYDRVLGGYEDALREYARLEAAGELTEGDGVALDRLYEEYTRLGEEYRRLAGG